MRLLYVSDLHLSSSLEDKTKRFTAFLRDVPQEGDTLVLGGDIFDLLVGDKPAFRAKFREIRERICELSAKGVAVYYLEGNHDFHLNGFFPGARVEADEFSLEWQGKRFWFSHGDMIDEEDRGYRLLRCITRSPPFRLFIRLIPGALVDAIGRWSSRQSRKYHDVGDVRGGRRDRLRRLYIEYAEEKIAHGHDFVLIGHSHLADKVVLRSRDRVGEYVNLGFSPGSIPYGVLNRGGESFSLKSYP